MSANDVLRNHIQELDTVIDGIEAVMIIMDVESGERILTHHHHRAVKYLNQAIDELFQARLMYQRAIESDGGVVGIKPRYRQ